VKPNQPTDDRVQTAFNELAATYDREFTDLPAGRSLRKTIWRAITERVSPGKQVLELGCGTGEDALFLARRGIRVMGTDISAEMVEQARRKLAGFEADASIAVCEIARLGEFLASRLSAGNSRIPETFDAILANFGSLNCIASLEPVRDLAERHLAAEGHLFLCMINRFCLRELLRGRFRRLRRSGAEAKCGAHRIPIYYHAPRHLRWPGFRTVELLGLGVFSGEDVRRYPPFNRAGDHYLAVLQKRGRE
jgi:SAM-dependent methyltransferase